MKSAHALKSPRQRFHQSSDNVPSVSLPIPPRSIISNSSQCHFLKLPPFSFNPQVPSSEIPSSRSERPPRSTFSLPVSAYQALILFGVDGKAVDFSALALVTAPFLVCLEKHDQAKRILPGDVFPSAGRPRSSRYCSCPSEWRKGDGEYPRAGPSRNPPRLPAYTCSAHENRTASSTCFAAWIRSMACLVVSVSYVSFFCHSVSLMSVLCFFAVQPNASLGCSNCSLAQHIFFITCNF